MNRGAVLILGGRSDIGLAIARRFAEAGHPIQLAARAPDDLEAEKTDIELRYQIEISLHPFDALDRDSHEVFLEHLPALPEIVVCAVGALGEQTADEKDLASATQVLRANFEGPANILGLLANRFEARGSGVIVGISSVAGQRGRKKNYIYGSAKAGFTAFLSGLRNRLADKGVQVITVLPGFVATRMTQGMDLPAKLTADPQEVAEKVFRAVEKGKDVIYVKPVWRIIMLIIQHIPERIFKRLDI